MTNMAAAREAEKEFGAEIRVIRKTSKEYQAEKEPLPCPSVVVNDRIIARNDVVSLEALKTEILNSGAR
jgi:hypothetical protein